MSKFKEKGEGVRFLGAIGATGYYGNQTTPTERTEVRAPLDHHNGARTSVRIGAISPIPRACN
ncbi:MAG: hypothetical protein AAGJ81_14025 [Verrucomicrobiota bacterium]